MYLLAILVDNYHMRRGNKRKFARVKNQRAALYKGLATALIEHGKINTTLAKAKSLSQFIDKLIAKAKKKDIASRRLVRQNIGDKATNKLFFDIAPRFQNRSGGYTKVLRLGRRTSDGAEIAQIKFTN